MSTQNSSEKMRSHVKKRFKGSKEPIEKDLTLEENSFNKPNRQPIPLRVLSRIAIVTSLLIIVYFTSEKEKKLITFAKQSEVLRSKGLMVECSNEYRKELADYEGCLPKNCGRFVTDSIVSSLEVNALLNIVQKGLKNGGSNGGASTLDLHSGALSFGEKFINFYKWDKLKNTFTEQDFITYRVVKDKIKYAVAQSFGVNPEKLYLTHPTFFSQITEKPAKTLHDEYWHPHVDKETYQAFHYTTLLYLSDYKVDFNGGRFIFIDKNGNSTIEPRKARVSMFTSGAENTHYVEKVLSGVRYAVTISFTCNPKYAISDPKI